MSRKPLLPSRNKKTFNIRISEIFSNTFIVNASPVNDMLLLGEANIDM